MHVQFWSKIKFWFWHPKVKTTDKTQMSGPDLHVFTLKFHSNFSPKKNWFFHFFGLKKKFSKKNYKIIMQLFSADAIMFLKKFLKFFFTPKKWKNGPQKLLIIGPDPFISQTSQDQRPTAQNWFFILWNLGTRHLFSYLCIYYYFKRLRHSSKVPDS